MTNELLIISGIGLWAIFGLITLGFDVQKLRRRVEELERKYEKRL